MDTATPARSTWASPRRPFPHTPNPAAPSGLAAVCRRRQPTATPLYPIVQHHLATFLARAAEEDALGDGLPGWVEEDFSAYLRCGILGHGFARIRCDACAAERLRVLLCAIRTTLRRTNPGAGPDSQLGASGTMSPLTRPSPAATVSLIHQARCDFGPSRRSPGARGKALAAKA